MRTLRPFSMRLVGAALAAAAAGGAWPGLVAAQGVAAAEPARLTAVGWVGAGIVLLLGSALLYVNWRRRRAVASATRAAANERLLRAGLETARAAALTWNADGTVAATPNLGKLLDLDARTPDLAAVLQAFDGSGATALGSAVAALRGDGKDFVETLGLRGRARYIVIHGKRIGSGTDALDFLGFQDTTDTLTLLIEREREAQRLRGVIDIVPIPIWIRDAEQRIQDCNLAYIRAVEAADRAAVLAGNKEFAEGADADAARALAERVHQSGEPGRAEQHIVVAGTRRLFEIGETPISATSTAGYALDITSEEEVKQTGERTARAHNEVLDRLAIAIIIVGPDGALRFHNGAFARLWGLNEAWLEHRPNLGDLLDQLHDRRMMPETGDFAGMKRQWLAWRTQLIEPRQELLHLPNGMAIWMVVSPHPLGGLLFTFENVTYRLALERSVNTLAAVQRDTIDHLFDGVAVFGEDGCLKLSNPSFRRMWRLDEEFAAGSPHVGVMLDHVRALIPVEEGWEAAKTSIMTRVTNRKLRQGRVRRPDDSIIAYALVPLPDGGVLASCRDLTDTVRVERALRERAEALEAADRVKADFIANISYELRTPLNAIIGFTEILGNQYFGPLNPRQKEYTEGVLEASQHLLTLINDILDLAVIEAGRMVLDIEPVSVKAVIDNVVQLTGEWARGQNLTLETAVDAEAGTIFADERRIKHALFNLVGNAIKFTPAGGRITLSARRDGTQVALAVEDTGMGISEEDRDRVFETFARGKDKHGRPAGAGLGLALVRSLVELHGGQVELESKPGTGTKVTCWLPVRARSGQAQPVLAQRPSGAPGGDGANSGPGLRRNQGPKAAA